MLTSWFSVILLRRGSRITPPFSSLWGCWTEWLGRMNPRSPVGVHLQRIVQLPVRNDKYPDINAIFVFIVLRLRCFIFLPLHGYLWFFTYILDPLYLTLSFLLFYYISAADLLHLFPPLFSSISGHRANCGWELQHMDSDNRRCGALKSP